MLYSCPGKGHERSCMLYTCPVSGHERSCMLYTCPKRGHERSYMLYTCPGRDYEKLCMLYTCPVSDHEKLCMLYTCPKRGHERSCMLYSPALEEAMKTFSEAKAGVTTKTYDYLDHRNAEFDADFDTFLGKTDALKESVGALIEENFANVWETPQGIRFLIRFEKVSEKIPLTQMDDKYDRVLKYCEHEVERILKLFKKQKDEPPLPRNFPPIAATFLKEVSSGLCHICQNICHPKREYKHPAVRAPTTHSESILTARITGASLKSISHRLGYSTRSPVCRIKWARSLHSHLDELVKSATSHPVLKTLPTTAELLRRYNIVGNALIAYEAEMKDAWMNQNVSGSPYTCR
uniref:Dynein heavy chain tail domain-containing protein n=1 Tax=Timema monikensis TaxID=170555 RepID=A0A7R9DY09_9NEOP|nr:unnamed protein product [Timema monikensis]